MAAAATAPTSSFGQYLAGQSGTGDFLGATLKQTDPVATVDQGPTKVSGSKLYQGAHEFGEAATKSGKAGLQESLAARGGLAKGGGAVKAKTADQKAVKAGNSYSNDKIPAMLSEGEIVVPRSIIQAKDPVRSSADFVAKVLAKRGKAS